MAGAAVVLLLVTACGSAEKAPAEAAIKAAEDALAAARGEAARYVPDQLKSVEAALASAKAAFDKGDYTVALNGAKDLAVKAKDLGVAATAKKAELAKTWADVSGGVPQMAEAIKSRVDILSQSKKLPAGLDKAKLDGVKAELATLNQTWTEASEAYKTGNFTDAIGKATTAKSKATEIMTALNMQLPAAAR